jgi:hypothetical protein
VDGRMLVVDSFSCGFYMESVIKQEHYFLRFEPLAEPP